MEEEEDDLPWLTEEGQRRVGPAVMVIILLGVFVFIVLLLLMDVAPAVLEALRYVWTHGADESTAYFRLAVDALSKMLASTWIVVLLYFLVRWAVWKIAEDDEEEENGET